MHKHNNKQKNRILITNVLAPECFLKSLGRPNWPAMTRSGLNMGVTHNSDRKRLQTQAQSERTERYTNAQGETYVLPGGGGGGGDSHMEWTRMLVGNFKINP